MSGNYSVLHTSSGYFAVVSRGGRICILDSDIEGLVSQLKREQREGRLKDGSIVTGEPVYRDSDDIHGLTH